MTHYNEFMIFDTFGEVVEHNTQVARLRLEIGDTADHPGSTKPEARLQGPATYRFWLSYGSIGFERVRDAAALHHTLAARITALDEVQDRQPDDDAEPDVFARWAMDLSSAADHLNQAAKELAGAVKAGRIELKDAAPAEQSV